MTWALPGEPMRMRSSPRGLRLSRSITADHMLQVELDTGERFFGFLGEAGFLLPEVFHLRLDLLALCGDLLPGRLFFAGVFGFLVLAASQSPDPDKVDDAAIPTAPARPGRLA